MAELDPSPLVRAEAANLWVALTECAGDPKKVMAALDRAAEKGDVDLFPSILSFALIGFFTSSWPAVLAQLQAHGVTGDAVQTGIGTVLAGQVSAYLRADVTPEEA